MIFKLMRKESKFRLHRHWNR